MELELLYRLGMPQKWGDTFQGNSGFDNVVAQ